MSESLNSLLKRLNFKLLNHIILISVASFTSISGVIFLRANQNTINSLNEQTLHREQVIVRAGAKSIEMFLELLSFQIIGTATRKSIVERDETVDEVLNAFMDRWGKTAVSGVLLTDKNGIVTHHRSETNIKDLGNDISDRSYFKWARVTNEQIVFISEPIVSKVGISKGKFVVTLTSPIYSSNEFDGVITVAVVLSDLAETYLEPLKLSQTSIIFLLDGKGRVIHSPYAQLTGLNIYDYLNDHSYDGSSEVMSGFKNAEISGDEGKMNVVLANDNTGELMRFLIAYAPVRPMLGNYWVLVLGTPQEEALKFFWPFKGNQSLGLVFGITSIISISLLSLLTVRIARRDAYLDGFVDGRELIGSNIRSYKMVSKISNTRKKHKSASE